jgi:hypothetical protein
MNIKSILTEWQFRLPSGYPKQASDYKILEQILVENGITLSEATRIVRNAQQLNEQGGTTIIQSAYNNRVFRVVQNDVVSVYSEQPFDEHDFSPSNVATGKVPATKISAEQFAQAIDSSRTFNSYKIDSGNLVDQSSLLGSELLDQVATPADVVERFKKLGLPDNLVQQIIHTYNGLDGDAKALFDSNYRQHTIESFVKGGYRAFKDFFGILYTDKSTGAMGRGEIQTLLALTDSTSGGTAQHDIIIDGKEWEVKELDPKKKSFRPAKKGRPGNFEITRQIQSFFSEIVFPFANLGDPYNELKSLVEEQSHDQLRKLVDVIEKRFESLTTPEIINATNEWKTSLWYNWYEGFKELNHIFYQTKLDNNVQDTRIAVKSANSDQTYWLSSDDAEKIQSAAGSNDSVSINVGTPIEDINKNALIWFKRLEASPMIKNPNLIVTGLDDVKNTFFAGIEGMIYFMEEIPHIGYPQDFVVTGLSMNQYTFRLRSYSTNANYPFIALQS